MVTSPMYLHDKKTNIKDNTKSQELFPLCSLLLNVVGVYVCVCVCACMGLCSKAIAA